MGCVCGWFAFAGRCGWSYVNNDGRTTTTTITSSPTHAHTSPQTQQTTKQNSTVTEWHGCGKNGDRKLATWMVGSATHNPAFNAAWSDDVVDWLLH